MGFLHRLMLLVFAALAAVAATEVYNHVQLRQSRLADSRQQALNMATLIGAQQEQLVEGVRQILLLLRYSPAIRGGDFARCQEALGRVTEGLPPYLDLQVIDVHGLVRCATDGAALGIGLADRPHVRQALRAGQFVVGQHILLRTTGNAALPFAMSYAGGDGRPAGAIVAVLSLDWLHRHLQSHPLPDGATALIADRGGTVLARVPGEADLVGSRLPARFGTMLRAAAPGVTETLGMQGRERLFGYVPAGAGAAGLFVAVGLDKRALTASLNAAALRVALMLALVMAAGYATIWWVVRRDLWRPVTALAGAADRWRRGDRSSRANLARGSAEMVGLGEAFDAMAAEVERVEGTLRQARDEAERANMAKSRFLAAASHDLRQPLQSTYLFMELARAQADGERVSEPLARIQQSLDAMKWLLDGLLDVSRLDAGLVDPAPRPVALAEVVAEIDAEFRPAAAAKGLGWRIDGCDGRWVHSDPTLLRQMLRCLADNAVKYTPRGEIDIHCRAAEDRLWLEIRDTGIGIPADQIEAVFEEFHQVGNPERDRGKGLGLGLAVVRRLSRMLDHPVELRSVPGGGTVFGIGLAPAPAGLAAAAGTAAVAAAGAGWFAVVIEDEAEVLAGLEAMLRSWGYDVLGAASADAAVAALRHSGRRPDIVVSDYRLPDGKVGTEAVQAIKAAVGADIPALILTGETGDLALRDAARHDLAVLHKPVPPATLRQELDRRLVAR